MLEKKINFTELQSLSKAFADSKYFDNSTAAQAMVKILAGREMGLEPFNSMSGIHIIKGKPTVGANIISTLIENSQKYDYEVLVCDETKCEIQFYSNKKKKGIGSFTIEEAKRARLLEKDIWKMYPSDMLFARAIARGSRRYAPGIFGGSPVYTPDDLGSDVVDMDEDGYIVNVKPDKTEAIVNTSTPLLHESVIDLKACVEDARRKGACSDQLIDHIFNKEEISDWPELKPARAKVWVNYIQGRVKKFEDEEKLKEATKAIQETKDIIENEFGDVQVLAVKQAEEVI